MKIKSVSGVVCSVKNLNRTVGFYETLGFETKKRDAAHATLYSNWFWIDFLAAGKNDRPGMAKGPNAATRGSGILLYLSMDDVDAFHEHLVSKGLKPAAKPQDQPWGNREFLLRDPDGYNLIIFKRK